MRVVDLIEETQSSIRELTEKYCENCQEFDCDYCPFDAERSEDG